MIRSQESLEVTQERVCAFGQFSEAVEIIEEHSLKLL